MNLKRLAGSGAGGIWQDGDDFLLTPHAQPMLDNFDLWLAGTTRRDVFAGGGQHIDLDGNTSGLKDLFPFVPIGVDNRGTRITGFSDANGATLVHQFRFFIFVSNAALVVTPRLWDITAAAAATIADDLACSGVSESYAGVNQQQAITFSAPTALHYFRPQYLVAGTPAAGYRIRVTAFYDCYVSLP